MKLKKAIDNINEVLPQFFQQGQAAGQPAAAAGAEPVIDPMAAAGVPQVPVAPQEQGQVAAVDPNAPVAPQEQETTFNKEEADALIAIVKKDLPAMLNKLLPSAIKKIFGGQGPIKKV